MHSIAYSIANRWVYKLRSEGRIKAIKHPYSIPAAMNSISCPHVKHSRSPLPSLQGPVARATGRTLFFFGKLGYMCTPYGVQENRKSHGFAIGV